MAASAAPLHATMPRRRNKQRSSPLPTTVNVEQSLDQTLSPPQTIGTSPNTSNGAMLALVDSASLSHQDSNSSLCIGAPAAVSSPLGNLRARCFPMQSFRGAELRRRSFVPPSDASFGVSSHHSEGYASMIGRHSTDSMVDFFSNTSPASQQPPPFPVSLYGAKDSMALHDLPASPHQRGVTVVYPLATSPTEAVPPNGMGASGLGSIRFPTNANEDLAQVRVEGYYEVDNVRVLIPSDLPRSRVLYVLTASDGRDLMFKLVQYSLQLTICFLKTPSLFSAEALPFVDHWALRFFRNYNTIRHGRSLFKMGRGLLNFFTLQTVCERMWMRYGPRALEFVGPYLYAILLQLEQHGKRLGLPTAWLRRPLQLTWRWSHRGSSDDVPPEPFLSSWGAFSAPPSLVDRRPSLIEDDVYIHTSALECGTGGTSATVPSTVVESSVGLHPTTEECFGSSGADRSEVGSPMQNNSTARPFFFTSASKAAAAYLQSTASRHRLHSDQSSSKEVGRTSSSSTAPQHAEMKNARTSRTSSRPPLSPSSPPPPPPPAEGPLAGTLPPVPPVTTNTIAADGAGAASSPGRQLLLRPLRQSRQQAADYDGDVESSGTDAATAVMAPISSFSSGGGGSPSGPPPSQHRTNLASPDIFTTTTTSTTTPTPTASMPEDFASSGPMSRHGRLTQIFAPTAPPSQADYLAASTNGGMAGDGWMLKDVTTRAAPADGPPCVNGTAAAAGAATEAREPAAEPPAGDSLTADLGFVSPCDNSDVSLRSSTSCSSFHVRSGALGESHGAGGRFAGELQPAENALPVRWRKGVLQFSPLLMTFLGVRNAAAACRRFLRDATLVSTERFSTFGFIECHRRTITHVINRSWFVVALLDVLLNTVRLLQPGWVKYATARQNIRCRCGCRGSEDPDDTVWRNHGFIARRKTDLFFPPLNLDYGAPFASNIAYLEAADPIHMMPACRHCGYLYKETPLEDDEGVVESGGGGGGRVEAESSSGWSAKGREWGGGALGTPAASTKPRWVQLYDEEVRENGADGALPVLTAPASNLTSSAAAYPEVPVNGNRLRPRRRREVIGDDADGIMLVPWLMRKLFDYVWLLRVHSNLTSTMLLQLRYMAELYLAYRYCFTDMETFRSDAPLDRILHPTAAVAGIISAAVGLLRVIESAPS